MKYIRVRWTHTFPDEPVWLYSELDEKRQEVRKVELYADGRVDVASGTRSTGTTELSEVSIPSLDEINSDSQFAAVEIDRDEFERAWSNARISN